MQRILNNNERKAMFVLIVVLSNTLLGCAGSTGWRFEVGVSPVKQMNNNVGLTQENTSIKRKGY